MLDQHNSGKRTRSFQGCASCRSRRLKCSEEKPACAKCRDAGLTCGYENSLFFDTDDVCDGDQATRFRRPLFSLEERASMSKELISSIPPHLALHRIAEIDSYCEDIPSSENAQISHGPFGAFRVHGSRYANAGPSTSGSKFQGGEESNVHDSADEELCVTESGALMSPNTQAAMDSLLSNPTYELDLDLWDAAAGLDVLGGPLNITSHSEMHFEEPSAPIELLDDLRFFQSTAGQANNYFTVSRSLTPVTCAQIDIPQSALVLLKQYQGHVLKAMTPFHHSKTPWHVLFAPLVKNCLAGLTLQDDVDRATLCVFYGTLVISALSLSGITQSSDWSRKSEIYRQRAYEHAKASLETAYDLPKKAKYKTQLMAFLTMVQMSAVSGQQHETEYFLLEAEKFIRMRGLNRRKSRRVRLLHHCYAYERIIFETTAVRDAISSQYHKHVRKAIEASGATAYSRDSLSFRLSIWQNLETDMLRVKDRQSGENDLHLQIPGSWPETLFPEIFGIPETHLFLVSLIIRLSSERDAEDTEDAPSNLDLKDFLIRAKDIERLIKQQRPPRPATHTDLSYLLEATHQAVVILFYRKIYDMDASMLQQQVHIVRDCLLSYDAINSERGFALMRLIWPAYVAGCEADDSTVQAAFLNWFETAAKESGFPLFTMTLSRIQDVWRKRHRIPISC